MPTDLEIELIEICAEIGTVARTNAHFTAGMAREIEKTGLAIKSLTVGGLLALIRQHRETYNRLHKPE
jgi:hypothetical protein